MQEKTVKAVVVKKKASDNDGYIKIRITQNRKSRYDSLRIKIPVRYWNEKKERVKSTDKLDYKELNKKIEDKLRKYKEVLFEQEEEVNNDEVKDDEKSFLVFYNSLIKRLEEESKFGSVKKFKSCLTSITDFIKDQGKTDLKFSEINKDWVLDYRAFLLNQKCLSVNTSNRYIIHFKTCLNKAIQADVFHYLKHPFLSITTPKESKKDNHLTTEELNQIIELESSDSRINQIKTKYLFQVFGQGLRVSDLLLMRWSNISEGRMTYKMFKTKQDHSVVLTHNLYILLADVLLDTDFTKELSGYSNLQTPHNELNKYLQEVRHIDKPVQIPLQKLEAWKKVKPSASASIDERIKKEEFEKIDEQLRFLKFKKVEATIALLEQVLKSKYRTCFIFDLLDNELFKDFDYFKPKKEQFNQLMSRTAVYNRQLKDLAKAAEIFKPLVSHSARHTYSNLMLSLGADVYEISKSLNHSGLNITENYLQRFNSKKVDDVNQRLSDSISL